MANRSHPEAFLFTHELDALDLNTVRQGRGYAAFLDGEEPATIHLRPGRTIPNGYSSAYFLPLTWKVGDIPEDVPGAFPEHIDGDADGVVLLIEGGSGSRRVACVVMKGSRRIEAEVKLVETGAHAFTRNKAILESGILGHKVALCIGLGSGGAPVVNDLARSGVGRFILWDNDRVEAHNVGRHICGIESIGRLKTHVLRDHIASINPLANVVTVEEDVMDHWELGGKLYDAVAAADIVIAATDNNPSRFAINEAAWNLRKPVLFGRAYTRACGGDVIQVIPEEDTPCYACQVDARVVEEEVSSKRDADAVAYADRPVPIEPGLHVDIAPISNMISRLALARLSMGTGSTLDSLARELDASFYLWGNRREHDFARWEPMRRGFSSFSILRWYGITVHKDENCSVCGKQAHGTASSM